MTEQNNGIRVNRGSANICSAQWHMTCAGQKRHDIIYLFRSEFAQRPDVARFVWAPYLRLSLECMNDAYQSPAQVS